MRMGIRLVCSNFFWLFSPCGSKRKIRKRRIERTSMQPAPELVALLERYYAASAQGDTVFLDQLIARDPGTLVVGTDATEWWRGGDEIVQTWAAAWRTR